MEDLDSLKHSPSVLKVYSLYTKLRKEGNKWMGSCPFHKDNVSSFVVYEKDMLSHCFAGCGSFNVIQVVEKADGISFREAVDKVKNIVGVGPSKYAEQAAAVDRVFKPAVQDAAKSYKVFSLQEYGVYERNLANSKEAQAWLAGRGISLETAQRLHTGFRQTLKMRDDDKNLDISDRGWLVFPCLVDNKVVSLKYRSVVAGRKAFSKQAGMATALYNSDTIDPFSDVLVCEGELDVMALEQAGFRSVSLASASTSLGPTEKDRLMSANRVVLAGDNDDPGRAAMTKLWNQLGERTFLVDWGDSKDANELYLKDKNGFVQKMDKLIGQALAQPMKDVYSLQGVMLSGGKGPQADRPDRLRFGWKDVDDMLIIVPGDVLSIFATQTGTGKTAFQMNTSVFNAVTFARRVLNWQCELDPTLFATITTAHILKRHRNHLTREDFIEAAEQMGEVGYYVGYDPMLEAEAALDLMEAAIKRLNIDILVIDNVAIMVRSASNEVSLQAVVNKRLKSIAQTHKCIVIALGAPKKADNTRRGKVVQIQDLKGSGTASDDVDGLLALHREVVKSDDSGVPARDNLEAKTKVVLLKARNKGAGLAQAELMFVGEFATFMSLDYVHTGEPE
jgi:5S rRNA maturation endonuclease (ribonuclease M5)